MSRPRLLDLFCGAGGCAAGYARAGFDIPQPDHTAAGDVATLRAVYHALRTIGAAS